MSKHHAALVLLGSLVCIAPGIAAEPLSQDFEELVVTATRTERPIEDVPAAVTTIDEERLKEMPLLGPREALTGIPGVQAETRNSGYDARLIIRGAGLKARYGVREIMVLLDGVPITDPDGMTRLDVIDTQLIERVEVVRGPNSTLYGANASGGVIHITSRDPLDARQSVRLGYGSDQTQLASMLLSTHRDATYLTLGGTFKHSDGWREWNAFESRQGTLKLGHLFADDSTLELTYTYAEADLQLPGTLGREAFVSDPSQLTSEPFRHNSRSSTIHSTSLRYELERGDWQLRPLVYFQSWEHLHPVPGSINDGGAEIVGGDLQVDYRHRLFTLPATLTFGVAAQQDAGDNRKYTYRDVASAGPAILYTLSDAKGELAEVNEEQVGKLGLYAQQSFAPNDAWVVDFGFRYDRIEFDIDTSVDREFVWGADFYRSYSPPEEIAVAETFEAISPRFGLVYHLSDATSLYGNIATGFQTPQASELEDNPELDPARTDNYELGTRFRHPQGHRFDAAVFYQEVQHEIVQTLLADNQVAYSNAGKTEKRGAELAFQAALPLDLSLFGSYTYSDFTFAEYLEPVREFNPLTSSTEIVIYDRGGNRLPYIPEHQYSLGLGWEHPLGFKARLESHTWGDYWVDNANSQSYTGYDFVTNLMLGWERGAWNVVLDIANLCDEHYAMEVTKSGDELRYRPGAPRSWFLKLAYNY